MDNTQMAAVEQGSVPELVAEDGLIVRIRVTERLRSMLGRERIFFGWSPVPDGLEIVIGRNARVEPYSQIYAGRSICEIGAMSYIHSQADAHLLRIGRWCSIATGLGILGEQHPIEQVTSSNFFRRLSANDLFAAARSELMSDCFRSVPASQPRNPIDIGNDVWIGQNVLLKSGIRIGNGAVIAAGAVVTRNVQDYSIVGGVPARLIRMRFPDHVVAALLRSEWWKYHPSVLSRFGVLSVEGFLDRFFQAQSANELRLFNPLPLTWKRMKHELQIPSTDGAL